MKTKLVMTCLVCGMLLGPAVALAQDLEPYKLFYLEDPLRPEHLDTFRLIRQRASTPIAMGEVYVGAWEGLSLIEEHLVDYVRNDLAHCGGITTGKKIATACEPKGILTAWHGPGNISPISHLANAHVSLSVPNFISLSVSFAVVATGESS